MNVVHVARRVTGSVIRSGIGLSYRSEHYLSFYFRCSGNRTLIIVSHIGLQLRPRGGDTILTFRQRDLPRGKSESSDQIRYGVSLSLSTCLSTTEDTKRNLTVRMFVKVLLVTSSISR